MFERVSRGWSLMKQSWTVLRSDKELILFPILSSMACLIVMASFAIPILLVPELRDSMIRFVQRDQQAGAGAAQGFDPARVIGTVVAFCFYVVNYFVIIFFNTALVSCAIKRFEGGDPTVGYGLNEALSRTPQIFAWAVVSATVGMILRAIEERVQFIGKIVVGLIGVAWTAVTYLVIPVLAVERVGPFRAVKRSGELLTKTWGEALVGNLSLGLAGLLLTLPGILLLIAAPIVFFAMHSIVLAALIGVVGFLYLIAVSIVTSTLQQILLAGLYCYAARGVVPGGFSEDVMQSAFRRKKP